MRPPGVARVDRVDEPDRVAPGEGEGREGERQVAAGSAIAAETLSIAAAGPLRVAASARIRSKSAFVEPSGSASKSRRRTSQHS
jgi:hypothetical protein